MITLSVNVYEAAQRRLAVIFAEFDNLYISFSGGKDSGLLLNLCLQYMREHGITKPVAVMHQDFEAQFTATTEYVTRAMLDNADLIRPYWLCLPMAVDNAASQFAAYWYPWERGKEAIWCRPMPDYPCVYHLGNQRFDWYREGMHQTEIYRAFGAWWRTQCGGGRTAGLIGIRAQESLNRWRAVCRAKHKLGNLSWTTRNEDDTYTAYPLYDWMAADVWTANARFGYDYNRIYDLLHAAGVPPERMRVASPYSGAALSSLNLYRVIEPEIWARLIGRVAGANFAALYANSEALGWQHIDLPPGHSWRSFVDFLLGTLPGDIRQIYEPRFAAALADWQGQRDDNMPLYKRMAVCILKNDTTCKALAASKAKQQEGRRQRALKQYANL